MVENISNKWSMSKNNKNFSLFDENETVLEGKWGKSKQFPSPHVINWRLFCRLKKSSAADLC